MTQNNKMKTDFLNALSLCGLDFIRLKGKTLVERHRPLHDFTNLRNTFGVYPVANRVINTKVSPQVEAEIDHNISEHFLNFSSQDYLGLSQNEEVKNAVKNIIDEYGIHAASSPVLTGRNKLTETLENKLAEIFKAEQCLLYPTGWAACFGVIASLVTEVDYIITDALSHNSLQVACKYSTSHVQKFRHNDLDHMEKLLKKRRETEPNACIFVIVEGLYSMNSDMPDLKNVLRMVNKYEAILILDVAHDFGAMGQRGLGILETVEKENLENVVICGSFSKSFASNGGFVIGPEVIRQQLIVFSPTYTFSNGISPMQCAAALKCFDIIFSNEGDILRKKLKDNIDFAIKEFNKNGFITNGIPSPIVPVHIGADDLARLMSKEIIKQGLLANLAEYPGVPKNQAIFRFQIMSNHTKEQISDAVQRIKHAKMDAETILKSVLENIHINVN
jgi:7-keto-8-aminopelargonate synthetase-like enzyme